ncbi:MAG: ABC transporter substrate-binding protein [Chloroflexi bacterium]|nr:ABC transporter substrate-binding protein [Chloroflexota bacterium]
MSEFDRLLAELVTRRVSRREFIMRATALGLSASSIAALLAACAPAPAAPTPTAVVPPTPTPVAVKPPTPTPAKPIGGTLVYAQNMPIKELDSINPQTYPASYEAVFLLYDNLVTFDEQLNIVPGLAERWEVSPDQLTWTFYLRKNVKFHDGTPFNAEAVKFHIERILDPKVVTPNRTLWLHIKRIQIVDDHTIKLGTEKPFGPMLNYLAHGSGGITSPTAVQKLGKEFTARPVGTGPYKLQEFTPGVQVVLVRNDDYFKGKAALDKIVMKPVLEPGARVAMLETGEADLANDIPAEEAARLEKGANTRVIRQKGLRTFWLEMNLLKKPFDDPKVRQALAYAVDKKSMVKNLFLGYATVLDSPAAPAIKGYKSAQKYEYDLERAKRLLAEAGWKPGPTGILEKDGQPLKFTINTSEGEYPKDIQVVETAQAGFKKIGVDATIWKVEAAARWGYLRLPPAEAKYEMLLFGFNPSTGEINQHLRQIFYSNPTKEKAPLAWNLMWYSNPEVDRLIDLGETNIDPAKRAEYYGKVQELIAADAPLIYLYAVDLLVGARKNVEGVVIWPTIFTILRDAYKR